MKTKGNAASTTTIESPIFGIIAQSKILGQLIQMTLMSGRWWFWGEGARQGCGCGCGWIPSGRWRRRCRGAAKSQPKMKWARRDAEKGGESRSSCNLNFTCMKNAAHLLNARDVPVEQLGGRKGWGWGWGCGWGWGSQMEMETEGRDSGNESCLLTLSPFYPTPLTCLFGWILL